MDPSMLAQPDQEGGIVELLSHDVDGRGQKRAVEALARDRQRFTEQANKFDGTQDDSESLAAIVAAYDAAIDLVPILAEKLQEQPTEQP